MALHQSFPTALNGDGGTSDQSDQPVSSTSVSRTRHEPGKSRHQRHRRLEAVLGELVVFEVVEVVGKI